MQIGPATIQFFPDGSVRADQVLASAPHILPNKAAIFSVDGLTPGSYVFWCSVSAPNGSTHAAFGMKGTLTITP